VTTPAADDYAAIKARMEEIKAERLVPAEDVPEEPKQIQHHLTMDWSIYPPVNVSYG
jgi:hypothetical protein